MEKLFDHELNLEKINLVLTVPKNTGDAHHRNRAFHGVVLELDGIKEYHFLDGPRISLNRGEILYLPQNSNYDVESQKPGDCIAVNFLLTGMDKDNFEPFKTTLSNPVPAVELFKAADTIWNSKEEGYLLKTKSLLYDILYLVGRTLNAAHSPQKTARKILKAVKIIESNYYRIPIRISELAEICGMSEVYFRKQFRVLYGVSPLKYINSLKIARGIELLESRMYPIKEVAMMSGYEDEYYFSRDFKKAMGISPREYKSKHGGPRQE
jgi:AraC-like DNA-binding protein